MTKRFQVEIHDVEEHPSRVSPSRVSTVELTKFTIYIKHKGKTLFGVSTSTGDDHVVLTASALGHGDVAQITVPLEDGGSE